MTHALAPKVTAVWSSSYKGRPPLRTLQVTFDPRLYDKVVACRSLSVFNFGQFLSCEELYSDLAASTFSPVNVIKGKSPFGMRSHTDRWASARSTVAGIVEKLVYNGVEPAQQEMVYQLVRHFVPARVLITATDWSEPCLVWKNQTSDVDLHLLGKAIDEAIKQPIDAVLEGEQAIHAPFLNHELDGPFAVDQALRMMPASDDHGLLLAVNVLIRISMCRMIHGGLSLGTSEQDWEFFNNSVSPNWTLFSSVGEHIAEPTTHMVYACENYDGWAKFSRLKHLDELYERKISNG